MKSKRSFNFTVRLIHRYLGFFLAGIMAVYALSGVVLIYRDTDFLKRETQVERQLEPEIKADQLGQMLRIRDFKITKEEGDLLHFGTGIYNRTTGMATYTTKELPVVLNKLTHLHKSTSSEPLYWLNVFFGVSLLFFVVSSFFMFMPKTAILRNGIYFAIAGLVLTLILLFI